MYLHNLKIGTQLRLGLGLILAFLVVLGALAWLQMDKLWLQTKTLYEHPFQVRRAIGKLEVDVERMSRQMGNLFLANNDQETTTSLQSIEISKTDAERQIAIIYDLYLGPRGDVANLEDDFVKWHVLRDETIRLLKAGKTTDAEARIVTGGAQDVQADVVRSRLQKIDDFARGKGDELYQTATAQSGALDRQLAVIVAVFLLLSTIVAWWLIKGIKEPLAELTAATEQFRHGKLSVRSGYTSANEFGALSVSINTMAEAIETEMRITENAAQLAGVMLREEDVRSFCRELLKELLRHTGSQVGAVYFLNEAKTAFEHFESIGLGAGGRAAFSTSKLEGELGVAVATRQIQRIIGIPEDTRFAFAAASGDFMPREILTIPVLSEHEVTAVISLASIKSYSASAVRLVNDIWSVLTARMNGVLAFQKFMDLADRLEHQNRELESQKRELGAQAGELAEQNTELQMQKRQLDEASRLKSAFLSNMSHELRTPLNSVIALAGVLNRRLASAIPKEEHSYLEVIERNGKHLLTLINDILDLSRIEAGRQEISVSLFSIRDLAGQITEMLEPQASEKKLALLNQVSEGLPAIASDPDKCRHILQNLVGNAVKFTEQGQVTITAEMVEAGFQPAVAGGFQPPGESARKPAEQQIGNRPIRQAETSEAIAGNPKSEFRISVSDTGIGIPASQLPHIFDEFRQGDDSTSRKYGGTGLGLAIAKRYAILLGGGITVESEPGKGSTFILRLPLALEMSASGQTVETGCLSVERATGPAPFGEGQRILVVEDNEPAIIQLTDILQAQGYSIQVARNGKEALERIGQSLPDAMILDLMMPEVDGFQVLKAIRGEGRTSRLPVLILTAKHVTKEEVSCLKGNHIHQLIQKGDIDKTALLAAVARMVAPRQEPPAAPSSRRRRPTRPGKPIVLVVEDNPDNLRTAKALLDDRYQVIEAADGQAGIEQARKHQPDLILMDIALPGMDGVRALQEIRKDEILRHIPVIAITASAMKGDQETILAHGFDGYISKPIDVEQMNQILYEALN